MPDPKTYLDLRRAMEGLHAQLVLLRNGTGRSDELLWDLRSRIAFAKDGDPLGEELERECAKIEASQQRLASFYEPPDVLWPC